MSDRDAEQHRPHDRHERPGATRPGAMRPAAAADGRSRGRLRPQWPTFRGSPFLWGVLAFPLFLHLVTAAVSLGRGEGLTPFGIAFVVLVAVVFVVCLVGMVQTLRHPRPSRPSWLDEGDPRA